MLEIRLNSVAKLFLLNSCWQVLPNKKLKRKVHPQNHSSGINMRQTHSITWKLQGYAGNYYLMKQFHTNKIHVFLRPYQVPTVFISSDAIITSSRGTSSHALLAQFFKGEREYICFENFSEYKIKKNLTWRELFAIQLTLQSFATKIRNKSVCWETENSPHH